jgi:hypothetical protein
MKFKVQYFRITFTFNFKDVHKQNFFKWRPSGCAAALDFSQEEDFPQSYLPHYPTTWNWSEQKPVFSAGCTTSLRKENSAGAVLADSELHYRGAIVLQTTEIALRRAISPEF